MDAHTTVHGTNILIILVAIATGVALASRWVRLPYTVILVVVGLVLGAFRLVTVPHLTKDLLFAVFLPGLLFEAAYHLDYKSLRRDRVAILTLAVPGVAVALALTAALVVGLTNALGLQHAFTWQQGLVFGALIAATDPIAVVAVFRSLGAPQRLTTVVEAESLLNDGTAIVFFGLILAATGGGSSSVLDLVIEFVRVVGIGLAVGGGLGFLVCQLTRRLDEPMIELTLTAIAAYGSFALADQLGGSGVIATVVAGLLCGNYGAATGMTPATRAVVESFWEYIAFLLNSIVFLLIGFEVHADALVGAVGVILIAAAAALLARLAVAAATVTGISRTTNPLPWTWVSVLTWGGLRGALSMVLALSLPESFPARDLLITTTFGVVTLSIVAQGLTISPLLRICGLANRRDVTPRAG